MPIHHTLKAWQHAQRLAVECAIAANRFPDFEQSALADQLRRACYSIPLNIAEGTTRKGTPDYRKFLDTAWGSLAEVQSAWPSHGMWAISSRPSSGAWRRSLQKPVRLCSACSEKSAKPRIVLDPADCFPPCVCASSFCPSGRTSFSACLSTMTSLS